MLVRTDAYFEATRCTPCMLKELRDRVETLEAENAKLQDANDTWTDVVTEQAGAHVLERLAALEADAKEHGAEQSRLRTQRDEAREHAAARTLRDADHLLYIIRDIVPVEHADDGLIAFRFDNGTRLAFGCGPSGRLNFVSIQQGPDVPEIRSLLEEGS